MRKKRILFCGEATFLNTGYATYNRETLNYLHSTGKYELAELSAYGELNDERGNLTPWKFYGAMPNTSSEPKSSKQEIDDYNSKPTNQFGEWAFERVCLDFMPDVVCDIRDFWMLDFAERSPYRPYFHWCIMPTVDARPQARQWIGTYIGADACLTYSDWAGGILQDQSGGKINYLGSAPPSAHPAYQPKDKSELRKQYGLDPNVKIIGTVMRNQRRKLYPDLFEAFKIFLEGSDNKNVYLYCHTSYPDLGWDIPELLHQHEIAAHVLFTYICPETKQPFVSLFKGAVMQSPYTGKFNAQLSSVRTGASYDQLSDIINLFDVYVQYANSEGFGLPQVEAAACAVPVMATDYSAMESVVRKLGGVPLPPKALYKELETGCFRAVPDNENTAKEFAKFFSKSDKEIEEMGARTRKAFEKHYQWDKSGRMWEDYFDNIELRPIEETWLSQPNLQPPSPKPDIDYAKITQAEVARFLITDVLREPRFLNTHFEARLARDLVYGSATATTGGMYFNEESAAFEGKNTRQPFDFDMAYDHFCQLNQRKVAWEQRRVEQMNMRMQS
jgi:glycosyltransferase involved in cell wall biosynthesis|tara:strand:+ start:562 stop:2238 length:1677 start_codon:yes stop_codon:yes gene_type:complete